MSTKAYYIHVRQLSEKLVYPLAIRQGGMAAPKDVPEPKSNIFWLQKLGLRLKSSRVDELDTSLEDVNG